MIVIYNIPGIIALVFAFGVAALMQFLSRQLLPSSLQQLEVLYFSVSLLVVGYVFEKLGKRPRLYKIPVYIIGAILTAVMTINKFGPLAFAIEVIVLALCLLVLKAVQENMAWNEAKASLHGYLQLGDSYPDVHETLLMKALFQNKFTPARAAYIEHNKEVIHQLLHDKAVHLTVPQLQLLNQTYTQLNDGQNLVKFGWRLNYIKEMRGKLDNLKEGRSIGSMRIGV